MALAKRGGRFIAGVGQRAINTLSIRRPAPLASDKGAKGNRTSLVRVTGFTGGYTPSKEDFLRIIQKAIRPDVQGYKLVHSEVPSNFEDVFDEFSVYTSRSGENNVIFSLKSEDLYQKLPFSRALDPKARPGTLSDRTAWCGLLLPVLENNIVALNGFLLQKLQQKKQYSRMKWYSLVFTPFRPDVLILDNVEEDTVRDALKKHQPDAIVSFDFKPRGVRASKDENKLVLRFSSTEDLVAIRASLEKEGLKAFPLESERFNLRKAFAASEFRGVDRRIQVPVYTTDLSAPTGAVSSEKEELRTPAQAPVINEKPVEIADDVSGPLEEITLQGGGRRRGVNRRSKAGSEPERASGSAYSLATEDLFSEPVQQEVVEDNDDYYAIEERVSPFRYEYLSSGSNDGQQHASM
jgi:hypothetical protein